MNEDKILKELLQKALIEKASAGFTDKVMTQVQAIAADQASQFLRLTKRWKLLYKIAFAVLSLAVVIMSFSVKAVEVNIQNLIDERTAERITVFIVSFWVLLIINYLIIIDKKIRKPFM